MVFREKMASRKFLLVCMVQAINTTALFTGNLSGSEYVAITTLVFTGYLGANVYQKKE